MCAQVRKEIRCSRDQPAPFPQDTIAVEEPSVVLVNKALVVFLGLKSGRHLGSMSFQVDESKLK